MRKPCRKVDLGAGVTLELVQIPDGQFMMGRADGNNPRFGAEEPQHLVHLSGFWMGTYPVTQAQWKQVVALPKIDLDLEAMPSRLRFTGDDLPITGINWFEAQEFCCRLPLLTGFDYRLPTEAEWEYGCRAGTTTPFYFGETITPALANYDEKWEPMGFNRSKQLKPKGSFPPNGWGLYDMHGTVQELCLDSWHRSYGEKPEALKQNGNLPWQDNRPHVFFRVVRGCSLHKHYYFCRSDVRACDYEQARASIAKEGMVRTIL